MGCNLPARSIPPGSGNQLHQRGATGLGAFQRSGKSGKGSLINDGGEVG
jgi:hypothetical protein